MQKLFQDILDGNLKVETYLQNVRALTIFCGIHSPHNRKEYSILKDHYDFEESLIFYAQDHNIFINKDINFLTTMMPNITELCFVSEDPGSQKIKLLLSKWTGIKKLMIKIPEEKKYFHEYMKEFNILKSLETLVIYDYLLNP